METPLFLVQVSAGRRPVFVAECDDSGADRETFLRLVGPAGTLLQEMQVSPRDSFIVAAVWRSSRRVVLAEIDMMEIRPLPSPSSVLLAEVREALAGPPLAGGEPACQLALASWTVLRQGAGWFDARRRRLAEFFGAPVRMPE